MGDTGSLFLGGAVAWPSPLIMPCADSGGNYLHSGNLSDIIQVGSFRPPMESADKMALHHHLGAVRLERNKIVIVFCTVTAVFCLLAYLGIQGPVLRACLQAKGKEGAPWQWNSGAAAVP